MKFRNPTLKSFWNEVPWGLLGIKSCKVSKKLIFLSCRFLVPSAHSPYERGGIFLLQQHLVALCRWVFESAQLLQLWSGVRFSLWFWHGFNFCQLPTSPGLFFPTAPRTTRLSNHSSLPPGSFPPSPGVPGAWSHSWPGHSLRQKMENVMVGALGVCSFKSCSFPGTRAVFPYGLSWIRS